MPSKGDLAIRHCVGDGENVLWAIVGLENAKEGSVGFRSGDARLSPLRSACRRVIPEPYPNRHFTSDVEAAMGLGLAP